MNVRTFACVIDGSEAPWMAPTSHTCVLEVQATVQPLPWVAPAGVWVAVGMLLVMVQGALVFALMPFFRRLAAWFARRG